MNKKKLLQIIAILALIIAVPITVFIAQKRQEIRQRASGEQAQVYFTNENSATPISSITAAPGQTFTLVLHLNSNLLINGFDIKVNYGDKATLSGVALLDNRFDTEIVNTPLASASAAQQYQLSKFSFDTNSLISGDLALVRLTFTAFQTPGQATINFPSPEVTSRESEPVSVGPTGFAYTVAAVPTNCPTPPTSCPADPPGQIIIPLTLSNGSCTRYVCVTPVPTSPPACPTGLTCPADQTRVTDTLSNHACPQYRCVAISPTTSTNPSPTPPSGMGPQCNAFYTQLIAHFGTRSGNPNFDQKYDIGSHQGNTIIAQPDGDIDIADFGIFSQHAHDENWCGAKGAAAAYSISPADETRIGQWVEGQAQTYTIGITNTGTQPWNVDINNPNRVQLAVYVPRQLHPENPGLEWDDGQGHTAFYQQLVDLPDNASHSINPNSAPVNVPVTITFPAGASNWQAGAQSYVLVNRLLKQGAFFFSDSKQNRFTIARAPTTPPFVYHPADLNRDQKIDIADFNQWLSALRNPASGNGDINGDHTVNILDFNIWFTALRTLGANCGGGRYNYTGQGGQLTCAQ